VKEIFIIVGPTASGKSAYAVRLAKKLDGEVISADSRQVYKGLDIGTGKITKREMQGIPHHMLDVASPSRTFTAHDYVRKARPILEKILKAGKTPIICGGTGFYIDALVGRITLPDVPANAKLRRELRGKSAPQLFHMLQKLDKRRAKEIDRHNPVRLIRAIEIATALGNVPNMKQEPLPFETKWIGMKIAEIPLREKIHARLLSRMKAGMIAEAKKLHESGLSYKRMEALGLEYRYLALLLQKKISKEEMLEKLENEIWQYAKRQITYWKRSDAIEWQ
jgi:tRNA dimethylallyltransferase